MSRFSFPMQTYSGRINISTKTHIIIHLSMTRLSTWLQRKKTHFLSHIHTNPIAIRNMRFDNVDVKSITLPPSIHLIWLQYHLYFAFKSIMLRSSSSTPISSTCSAGILLRYGFERETIRLSIRLMFCHWCWCSRWARNGNTAEISTIYGSRHMQQINLHMNIRVIGKTIRTSSNRNNKIERWTKKELWKKNPRINFKRPYEMQPL